MQIGTRESIGTAAEAEAEVEVDPEAALALPQDAGCIVKLTLFATTGVDGDLGAEETARGLALVLEKARKTSGVTTIISAWHASI